MDYEKSERNKEFFNVYRETVKEIGVKNMYNMTVDKMLDLMLEKKASRFFISQRQANYYIRLKKKNLPLNLGKEREQMINDLYNTYLQKKEEMSGYYDYAVIDAAIFSPAPSFYISKRTAMKILYK